MAPHRVNLMNEIPLDLTKWRMFSIQDLFNRFETGKADGQSLMDGKDCLYLGAKHSDNCVMRHCAYDETLAHEGNCIVFICNGEGSVGFANYMDRPFIASKDLVMGYADWLNVQRGLFVSTVLSLERPKYSFGRKWKRHLSTTQILLPAVIENDNVSPDWRYIDKFMEDLPKEDISCNAIVPELELSEWSPFILSDLFDTIERSTPVVKGEMVVCNADDQDAIPLVSRTESNNGVDCYIHNDGTIPIERGNAIIIGDTTSTMFYQPKDFATGDHIVVCRSKWMTLPRALFLLTVLSKERYRYSYGRAFKIDLIRNTQVMLPSKNGKPDWTRMESYISSLPYGDRFKT